MQCLVEMVSSVCDILRHVKGQPATHKRRLKTVRGALSSKILTLTLTGFYLMNSLRSG